MTDLNLSNMAEHLGFKGGIESLQAKELIEKGVDAVAKQETAADTLKEAFTQAVNPNAPKQEAKRKTLGEFAEDVKKAMKAGGETVLVPVEKIENEVGKFKQKHPEFSNEDLDDIRVSVKQGATKEETRENVLALVNSKGKDAAQKDQLLEFLENTTTGDLQESIKEARAKFRDTVDEKSGVSNNKLLDNANRISARVGQAQDKGLSAVEMRALYQEVTSNNIDTLTLFNKLVKQYDFKELVQVTKFLGRTLSDDQKNPGPHVDPALLQDRFVEIRMLQAILNVYKFEKKRYPLVQSELEKRGIEIPPQLNFENATKQFLDYCGERYPSGNKVMEKAANLKVEQNVESTIIVLSLMFRDAIKEVSPKIFGDSQPKRNDAYNVLIEKLTDLEDILASKEEAAERSSSSSSSSSINY
jgi:hypothetical protein